MKTSEFALDFCRRCIILGSFRLTIYVLEGTVFCLHQFARFAAHTLGDMSRGLGGFGRYLDYEMFGSISQNVDDNQPLNLQSSDDIFSLIADRHLMIIGGTGAGKSTVAQYISYGVGGRVTVYEPEGLPGGWSGLELIGCGEDWGAIEAGMQFDLDLLSSKVKERHSFGDSVLNGTERVLICEEFPEVICQVSNAREWMERHARRGRKIRQFLILLGQYDKVSAWGLEGKSDLSECFYKLRLGKIAIAHAKRLQSPRLIQFLQESRSHALLEDEPIKLPSLEEMSKTSRCFLPPSQVLHNSFSEAAGKLLEGNSRSSYELMLEGIREGLSDYQILSKKLGISGGNQYRKRKAELMEIRKANSALTNSGASEGFESVDV